jgi:predicted anti-sigma-YlaC factor YlaD
MNDSNELRFAGRRLFHCAVVATLVLAAPGCSVKRIAVNKLGDALAGSGTTFSSDDDPELIKAAVPFSLKLMESLLSENPRHAGLLYAATSGFTQYGYAFVQQEADELEATDFAAAEQMRARARRLYLRAKNYGLRGLEVAHRDFTNQLVLKPRAAVAKLRQSDVPLAYWTAAAWGAAISLSKDDPAILAEIPQMEALIDRALELDESWDLGSIHTFLISYEMTRAGGEGDPAGRARRRFERAMELAQGHQAAPLVAYAESVSVEKQDVKEFEDLLNRALAINPDEQPPLRLVNLIMQRRARWLLERKEDLFLSVEKPSSR